MFLRSNTGSVSPLSIEVRRDGRRLRVLALTGVLNYYTASQFRAEYKLLIDTEGAILARLILDMRLVTEFDNAGIVALMEVVRDVEQRHLAFLVADRPDRPTYIATGLRDRLKFLSEAQAKILCA